MSFLLPTSLRSGTASAVAGVVLAAYPAGLVLPAVGYQFRPLTEVRHLAPTPMKAQDGSPISLGYRVTMHWFFLPYAVTADGFALKVEGKAEPVSLDTTQVRGLQNDKLLPDQLPGAALSWRDRVLGSLLWIMLLPMLGWFGVSRWRQARHAKAEAASKPVAQVPIERIAKSTPAKPETAPPAKADVPRSPAPTQPSPAVPAPAKSPAAAEQPAATTVQAAAPQQPVATQAQPQPQPRLQLTASQPKPAAAAPTRPAAAQAPSAQKAPPAPPAAKPALQEARIKCRVKALKAA